MSARERLAERQAAVLAAVLRGEVPPGFDPASTAATGRVLRTKRLRAATSAVPVLAAVPDMPRQFDRWARTQPESGSAHEDADGFVAALVSRHKRVPATVHAWWAYRQVYLGRRRAVLVRDGARRVLVLGLGSRVVGLAIRQAKE